jgi:LCP family protein required for cell wall assembly
MKILLLGSDQRPDEGGFRTDAILLVVLDSEQKSVSVVSFPRDLWVQVPSLYEMKINQVYELAGFDGTAEMMEANFGVRPDYFLMTNFTGFKTFIDNRGGIDVNVEQDLTDDCDLPQQVDGDCTVLQGMVHMDGPTALWYVRSRNTSSDLDRLRREQEVVYALVKKMVSFQTVAQISEIKDELQENVETNMSIEDGLKLIPFATSLLSNSDKIHKVAISEEQATPSWSWNGMWILLPDTNAIRALMEEVGINLN